MLASTQQIHHGPLSLCASRTKRQAVPVEQQRAEAEAREVEARAAAKRVRAEVESEEMERAAQRGTSRAAGHAAEHQELKAELRAWEASHKRKLKPSDLRADVELKVKYSRYRELCDAMDVGA